LSEVLSRAAKSAAAFADPTRRIVCQESDKQWFVLKQPARSLLGGAGEDQSIAYRRIVATVSVGRAAADGAAAVTWYETKETPRDSWSESREVISVGVLQPAGPNTIAEMGRRLGVPANYPTDSPVPLPRLAAIHLDAANQPRFEFRKAGTSRVDGLEVWKLDYQEKASPPHPDAAIRGAFWIDPLSGRVVKSVMTKATSPLGRQVTMTYVLHQATGLCLPARMKEQSDITDTMRIETTGDFSNCHAVPVGVR
jgi:hypothetical protein